MKDKFEPVLLIVKSKAAAEKYKPRKRSGTIRTIVDPCMLDNYMTSDEITEVMEAGATPTEEL